MIIFTIAIIRLISIAIIKLTSAKLNQIYYFAKKATRAPLALLHGIYGYCYLYFKNDMQIADNELKLIMEIEDTVEPYNVFVYEDTKLQSTPKCKIL